MVLDLFMYTTACPSPGRGSPVSLRAAPSGPGSSACDGLGTLGSHAAPCPSPPPA